MGSSISQEAEWRSGVSEDGVAHDPCRVGMASDPLYSASWGRATIISTTFKNRQKYGLAARINFHSSMNHRDRALHKAYGEFDVIGKDILQLTHCIISHAKGYYKKFSETALTVQIIVVCIKRSLHCSNAAEFNETNTVLFFVSSRGYKRLVPSPK